MTFRRQYKNAFGCAVVEQASEFVDISQILSDLVPGDCFISLEDAERLALVSDNRNLQVCPGEKLFFAIRHEGKWCIGRLVKLDWDNAYDAQTLLDYPRSPFVL